MSVPGANPLVSCLLVSSTAAARRRYLEASLACYAAQTWAPRELVIVCDGAAEDKACITELCERSGRSDIRTVFLPAKVSLGALRNASVAAAAGTIICQWDDDDLYHRRRIEAQARPLLGPDRLVTYLSEHMHFFEERRELYLVSWRKHPLGGHSGTCTIRKDAAPPYPEQGPRSERGEDAYVHNLMRAHPGGIEHVRARPYLYVYRFHGRNTWAADHHTRLIQRRGVTREGLDAIWSRLVEELQGLDFGDGSIQVMGCDGPLRSWSP